MNQWIKDRDEAAKVHATKTITAEDITLDWDFSESDYESFIAGADFTRSYEARKVAALIVDCLNVVKAVNDVQGENYIEALVHLQNRLETHLTNYESSSPKSDKGDEV